MKKFFAMMSVMVFGVFLVVFMSSLSQAEDKAIGFRYSSFFPPANKISVLSDQWCKEVEKRTNGRVKVDYYPGGTLTKAAQTYDSVKIGVADIGLSFTSYTPGRFPLTEVLDLPVGYKSSYVGTQMSNAYFQKFNPKEFNDVKLMYFVTVPPHRIFAKMAIRNLEELKGLKIRATGSTAEIAKALGASPVAMPMSEAYDALAKGVAEGVICPLEPMKGFRLAGVVSHCVLVDSAWANTFFVVMNKRKWNALPQDIKEIIEGINKEWMGKTGKTFGELDQEGKDVFLQKGGKIINLSTEEQARWTERLRPVLTAYAEKMKKKGLPGQDALNFCIDYLKTHQ